MIRTIKINLEKLSKPLLWREFIANLLCSIFSNISLIRYFSVFLIALLLLTLLTNNAYADRDRFRSCNSSGWDVRPDGLNYRISDGGEDFSVDLLNGYCAVIIVPAYAAVKVAITAMNYACVTGSTYRILPSPFLDLLDIAKAGKTAITFFTYTDPTKAAQAAICSTSIIAAGVVLATFVGGINASYETAQDAYKNSYLCGGGGDDNNWMAWNSTSMKRDIPKKKSAVEKIVQDWIKNCNKNPTLSDCTRIKEGLNNKNYREWYYGGVEKEDTGDNYCKDVTSHYIESTAAKSSSELFSKDTNTAINASYGAALVDYYTYNKKTSTYPPQKYYMRGTEPGNYACERFNHRLNKSDPLNNNAPLSPARIADYEEAYKCCQNRKKSSVCIERKYCSSGGIIDSILCPKENVVTNHIFCQGGTECSIGGVKIGDVNRVSYSAIYHDDNRMICVNTSSLCPYDFNLGGGTTKCDYYKDGITSDNGTFTSITIEDIAKQTCGNKSEIRNSDCSFKNEAGKCKNYCQLLNHCVIVDGNNYTYETDLNSSPYFSNACLNFIGDSQNEYGYNTGVFTGAQRHFTAPIAQCVRETLENVFYNRAGHSKCAQAGEYPDKDGKCFTNSYQFQKDLPVKDQSFFSYIQDHLKDAIKLVLTISIIMMGLKILLTNTVLKSSELIMYVVKIGVVLFFATGTAWQGFFFDGIYNISSTFSTIVMNIKTSPLEIQRDGCQFGKISLEDGSSSYASKKYPSGKEYLAVFDTFDCKIARYLGFGPSATVAGIAKIILPALLSATGGAIGVYFAVLTMAFGFFMIAIALRALHIFLTSSFAIILMVYVSPITITCSLFAKTKPIFDKWLIQIIGFSLQPIILFAYMGFFITIFETLVSGSATFSGNAPTKEIVCDKICVDKNGNTAVMVKDDGIGGIQKDINQSNNAIGEKINNAFSNNALTPTKPPICDLDKGSKILDPMSDSVACMMNLKNESFGQIPALEPLGIGLPILKDFFSENGRQKILAMMKAILIIYILSEFMGQIPGIASNLMGGNKLPGQDISAKDIASKAFGYMSAVQQRGAGAVKKLGGAIRGDITKAADELGSKKQDNKKSGGEKTGRTETENNVGQSNGGGSKEDFV